MPKLKHPVNLFFLLTACLLAGCQGNPLPDGMDESTVLSAGKDVLLLVVDGAYQDVYDLFRADVADSITVDDIRNLALRQLDGAGVYKQIDSSMVTGQSSGGENYGVAVLYCEFSKDTVLFRAAFDTTMELIGIDIKKQ